MSVRRATVIRFSDEERAEIDRLRLQPGSPFEGCSLAAFVRERVLADTRVAIVAAMREALVALREGQPDAVERLTDIFERAVLELRT